MYLIKAKDNLCVEDCNVGYKYLYDFKCYERCPKDTYSEDYICKKNIILNLVIYKIVPA